MTITNNQIGVNCNLGKAFLHGKNTSVSVSDLKVLRDGFAVCRSPSRSGGLRENRTLGCQLKPPARVSQDRKKGRVQSLWARSRACPIFCDALWGDTSFWSLYSQVLAQWYITLHVPQTSTVGAISKMTSQTKGRPSRSFREWHHPKTSTTDDPA